MKRYRALAFPRKSSFLFPMLFSLLAPLVLPRAFCQQACSAELFFDTKNPQAKKILFIGNSLTFVNQLPIVLAALVLDSNTASELKIGEVVKGGATLEELYEHTDAVATIERSGPWTEVVLQEQSDVAQPEKTQQYVDSFSQSVRRVSAHTLIFETWAHNNKLFD